MTDNTNQQQAIEERAVEILAENVEAILAGNKIPLIKMTEAMTLAEAEVVPAHRNSCCILAADFGQVSR